MTIPARVFPVLLATTLLLAGSARAAIITVDPEEQIVPVGSQVDVAINISGLGDMAPDSVGEFDFDVTFDDTILALQSVEFGDPVLGDQLDLFGWGSLTILTVGPGSVNVYELSFDFPEDLDTLQAGSFTLATLAFDTLAVGTSTIDVTFITLGDALGDPIPLQTIGGSVSPIPEPSSSILFGIGGLVVAGGIRRRLAAA